MPKTESLTIGDAHAFLISQAFRMTSTTEMQRVYHHRTTKTLILMPNEPDHATLYDQDIVSLRRRIVGRGIASNKVFSDFFGTIGAESVGDADSAMDAAA